VVRNFWDTLYKLAFNWQNFEARVRLQLKVAFIIRPYAAFTLNGFDDQERNLTFVKTGF